MTGTALEWRTEHALLKAWPALEQVAEGGWVLRFSNGLTRRANSANPVREPDGDFDGVIAAAERLYLARDLPCIFRVPSFLDPGLDRRLEQLGYGAEGESRCRIAAIDELPVRADDNVSLTPRPGADWLAALASFQEQTEDENAIYARIVSLIDVPARFATVWQDGRIVAVAYGAISDGLLCYNSVATQADYRGRGYASAILSLLAVWAKSTGADGACLSVQADNAGGKALYDRFGLRRELHRYHYRREPLPAIS